MKKDLALAVVPLGPGLGSVSPSVVFQVKLPIDHRKLRIALNGGGEPIEVILGLAKVNLGDSGKLLHLEAGLNHLFGRAAPTIAPAVGKQ